MDGQKIKNIQLLTHFENYWPSLSLGLEEKGDNLPAPVLKRAAGDAVEVLSQFRTRNSSRFNIVFATTIQLANSAELTSDGHVARVDLIKLSASIGFN